MAGVTALPTDPAVLLQLGPVANSLASALPTSSVLSVLLTAAPSGFVSNIVNDPSYASSFESDFAAGKSPAWFTSLPTSVRSYLHTYSGFGGLAGAGAAIKSVTAGAANGTAAIGSAISSASSSSTSSPTSNPTNSSDTSSSASGSTSLNSAESAASAASASAASAAYVSAVKGTGAVATAGNTLIQSGTSTGGAANPTGGVIAGWVGVVGLLGAAAAL